MKIVLNYDWNDLMKTMIKRGSDIKIIVQTMYDYSQASGILSNLVSTLSG